jgi:hypothetical protein
MVRGLSVATVAVNRLVGWSGNAAAKPSHLRRATDSSGCVVFASFRRRPVGTVLSSGRFCDKSVLDFSKN